MSLSAKTDEEPPNTLRHALIIFANEVCPNVREIILVMDNLNTYKEAFAPEKARALCERFEMHYTPARELA